MPDLIEGRNAVLQALASGMDVTDVLIARGVKENRVLQAIRREARDRGVEICSVERRELDTMSARGAHQGVVARVEPFSYAEIDDVLGDADESLLVVLDHVTDPGNLGAVIRSAEAFGATAVVLPRARAAGVNAVTMKAAAGAAAHLPIARVSNIARTLARLKSVGYWVVGASEDGDVTVHDVPLEGCLVIVLGAEGSGLSRLAAEACDYLVRIPLEGRTPSLNVAQAATVLLYERSRRRGG